MNTPVRRLLAFGLDYLLIATYLVILVAASTAVLATPIRTLYVAVWSNTWSAELAGFLFLTMPVVLYFALLESSEAGATWGKRRLRLRVLRFDGHQLSVRRALLRSAFKFLPWELAHFTIWHYVLGAAGHVSPPAWTTISLTVVYLVAGAYLVSLFIGRTHRTIYDRVAGSVVVLSPEPARPHLPLDRMSG